MTDGPGTGGGASGKRFAVVMGAIVLLGLAALGAAWWLLDGVAEGVRERRRKLAAIERRIETYLPTDRRPAVSRDPAVPEFVVRLRRGSAASTTRVEADAEALGEFTPVTAGAVENAARAWREKRRGAGVEPDLRGVVESSPAVPTSDVLRAVDALIAAGLKDVEFVGTPRPGSVLDRIGTGGK